MQIIIVLPRPILLHARPFIIQPPTPVKHNTTPKLIALALCRLATNSMRRLLQSLQITALHSHSKLTQCPPSHSQPRHVRWSFYHHLHCRNMLLNRVHFDALISNIKSNNHHKYNGDYNSQHVSFSTPHPPTLLFL